MATTLFSMLGWNQWREARLCDAKLEVGGLTLRELGGDDLDDLAEKIACKLRREPAVLDLGGATCTTSPLPEPTVLSRALGTQGPKLEMKYAIPFAGDEEMLWVRPTVSCTVGVPAVVGQDHVVVTTHSVEEWGRVKAALAEVSARLADTVRHWNGIALAEVRGLMAARHQWLKAEEARRQAAAAVRWGPPVFEAW